MKIDTKKYIECGEKKGLDPYLLNYENETETSVSVMDGKVSNQTIGSSAAVSGTALLNGRVGTFRTDAVDDDAPQLLADSIYESAPYGRERSAETFYPGGKEYQPADINDPGFREASLTELRDLSFRIYEKAKSIDPRVTHAEAGVGYDKGHSEISSSKGFEAEEDEAVYSGYVSIIVEEDGEPRSGWKIFHSFEGIEDLESKTDKAVDEAFHDAADFLHSPQIASGSYKAVLARNVFAFLLETTLSHLSAKRVHKHLSIFEGKKGEQILSPALTIDHTPHVRSTGSTSFDRDGVPTCDFPVIENGVLMNYFYSYESALEEGVEANGCGTGNGNDGPFVLSVKPGEKTLDQLFEEMGDGIYITDISGMNAGIDDQTLNFSLPCQGYVVKDGKKDSAFSMVLIAGNLKDLFQNVLDLSDETKYISSSFVPYALVGSIAVSGN